MDGSIRRVAAAHVDPSQEEWIRKLERSSPVDLEGSGVIAEVVRTAMPTTLPNIKDELMVEHAFNREHLAAMRGLRLSSAIIAPLTVGGQVLGVFSVFTVEGGRTPLGDADVDLVRELSVRAALALDRARLYQEAEAASLAKSRFLAVMSHELRTPLNAIIGYARLMEDGVPGPVNDAQRAHLARMRAAAWHLVGVIEEILTFTTAEVGGGELHEDRVDPAALAREVAELLEPQATSKGLVLEVAVPAGPLVTHTDEQKLRQIFLNLVGNAIKFTDEGRVLISLEEARGQVVIQVRDEGPGIAPPDLLRVFEPFTQLDQPPSRRKGGTGLGLAVSHRLAKLLGGDIAVESVVGEGTSFVFTLPLREAPALEPIPIPPIRDLSGS